MQTLAVGVLSGTGKVNRFKHDFTLEKRGRVLELIPLQDDYLIYRIEQIVVKKFPNKHSSGFKSAVEEAKTRIYKYARAMGRFLVGIMTFKPCNCHRPNFFALLFYSFMRSFVDILFLVLS